MGNVVLAVLIVGILPALLTLFTPVWLAAMIGVIANALVLSYAGKRMIERGES